MKKRDEVNFNFSIDGLTDYLNVASFRMAHLAHFNDKIAMVTARHLIILEGQVVSSKSSLDLQELLRTVVEFGDNSGRPSTVKWLTPLVVAVSWYNKHATLPLLLSIYSIICNISLSLNSFLTLV